MRFSKNGLFQKAVGTEAVQPALNDSIKHRETTFGRNGEANNTVPNATGEDTAIHPTCTLSFSLTLVTFG